MKAVSSRAFNQNVSEAKRMARLEPVFVTDRGKPTHVLLGIEAYRRLSGETKGAVELLAMPDLTPPQPTAEDGRHTGTRKWLAR
ncbi:MAG: type II toxin-antitoxin system Phd/YefM family antitoxin [Sphingomonadales bacterium]|nr:type II toxin-antitoxin system Phd/YefM family antitoxin [Sphingomonadales bacterium]MDE2171110.1 type II toxin-antitoxin system Phd/YefM family antitoxin [Sphingomonadales bacterium]